MRGMVGMVMLGERHRILLDQLHELHVPGRVVEAGALALDLVGEAAGADDRHVDIFGIALDRLAQRLAELEAAAPRSGSGIAARRPAAARSAPASPSRHASSSTDSGEKQPWSSALSWKKRHVELVGDEHLADMARERAVPLDRRQVARAAAFVRDPIFLADAEAEGGIMVEEEGGDVIVVDEEQHVGLLLLQPGGDRLIGVEDRLPDRILLLVGVEREADRRRVRGGDRADDAGHFTLRKPRAFPGGRRVFHIPMLRACERKIMSYTYNYCQCRREFGRPVFRRESAGRG